MSLYRVKNIKLHDDCYFSGEDVYTSEELWSTDTSCSKDAMYIPIYTSISCGELVMHEKVSVAVGTARWKIWRFWFQKLISSPSNWF